MYKKITTFEAACEVAKVNPLHLPEVSMIPEKFQKWILANYKLAIITQAINTDEKGKVWEPNYNDSNQWKYYPYFWVEASEEKPSGFAFSHSLYDYGVTNASLGSRLCFDNSAKVDHIQEHFEELFLDLLLIRE